MKSSALDINPKTNVAAARMVVNRKAHDGIVREILGRSDGWLAARDLPPIGRPTFNEWYRKKQKRQTDSNPNSMNGSA